MARPKVTKTAVKNAPGIRRVTRTYDDGHRTDKYEARLKDGTGSLVSLGMFASLADARSALIAGKSGVQKGGFASPSAGRAKFLTVAEDWLASPQVVQAKPRTKHGYGLLVHGRLSALHGANVGNLTHKELSRFVANLTADGLASATVRHIMFVLRCVLDEAVSQGLIASNPTASLKRPKLRTVKPYVLTMEDVEALITYLRTATNEVKEPLPHREKWALLVEFAAYTGCRASEIAGLQVRNLNLKARSVRIEGQMLEISGHLEHGTPKTEAGDRTVADLSPALCAALREFVMTLRPDDYVFGWVDGNGVSHPNRHGNFMRRIFNPAVEAVGLPTHRTKGGVGLHDLRHFHATLCIERGMTPIHVGKRLGHANATEVLRRYAHAWEQQEAKWGADFDALRTKAQRPALPVALPSNVVSLASRRKATA